MNNHVSLQYQVLSKGAAIIFPESALRDKLLIAEKEKRPLTVKLGFDPTAPDLHLGHAVVLRKLRQFQDYGHKVVIVIGDFTARIGDPTGKNKARPPLGEAQVLENAQTYIAQVSKILDTEKCAIVFNAAWLSAMAAEEVISMLSRYTVAQVMQRTDFHNRFREGTPIALHELVYPLLQGYDSVKINADIEIGGTDQLFNCTVGRHLQESFGRPTQAVMCMPLLRGVDGSAKMSKSERNTIGLTDSPGDMFGKIMSIPDALLEDFLLLASGFDEATREEKLQALQAGINPMQVKKELAYNITMLYHSSSAAAQAQQYFEQQFQRRDRAEIQYDPVWLRPEMLADEMMLLDLCKILVPGESRSALKRLIEGGGIILDGTRCIDAAAMIKNTAYPVKIRIGKKLFYEVCELKSDSRV